MSSPRARLALGTALISFTGVFARLAAVDGEAAALYRLVYALSILVVVAAVGGAVLFGDHLGRRHRVGTVAALGGHASPPASWQANAWLVLLALCTPILGAWLIVSAIGALPSVTSSAILLLQPLLAFVWGVSFFHELSTGRRLAGFVVAVAGIGALALTPPAGPEAPGTVTG